MSSSRAGYERLPMYASSESTTRLRSPTTSSHYSPPPSPIYSSPPLLPSPPRRRRSWSSTPAPKSFCFRPRSFLTVLKFGLPSSLFVLTMLWFLYEPHIEIAFYNRDWIKQEIDRVHPLAGCFDAGKVSPMYDVSEAIYGRRKTDVQAGVPLRMGMDCYDFAGTIQGEQKNLSHPMPLEKRTHFHSYWRTDLAPFGERQEWMLKSFFATQDISSTRFILWSNGDLSANLILSKYVDKYPDAFALRVVDIDEMAKGTSLEGSTLLKSKDNKAWTDGDLVRLLLLWAYGGVWIDMDSLLTRDLEPLLEHEFVTQWDCYGKYLLCFFRRKTPTLSYRQTLPTAQRCLNALPQTLPLPLRSLSHNVHLPPPTRRLNRLGLPPLLQALAASCRIIYPSLQSPPILLQRRAIM